MFEGTRTIEWKQIISAGAQALKRPKPLSKIKNWLAMNQVIGVSGEENNYYRVVEPSIGWMPKIDESGNPVCEDIFKVF